MAKSLMPVALMLLLAAGLATGCGGANNSGGGAASSSGAGTSTGTGDSSKTTMSGAATGKTGGKSESTGGTTTSSTTSGTGEVQIEQLSSGTMGPQERQILAASSAGDLAAAIGQRVPDSGQGTYVAVAWGEKPTGGYTVDFGSATVEGVRLKVDVKLMDPPPDAMVAQALTYPYGVAVIRGVDLGEKKLVFVNQNGRAIGWPIINV